MRLYIKTIVLITILTSFQSCKKVIDIDLPPTDSKVVVNSFFTEDSQIKVHLSKSIGILDNIIPECTDATVFVRGNDILIDTMYYQSGYYYSHILAETNKNYALEIIVPGTDTVFCEDIIPEKTFLQNCVCTDSVLIDEDGMVINELKLDFQDLAGPTFYEVELTATDIISNYKWRLGFKNNSDPIITSTGLLDYNPGTLIFTDKMFDGKHCSVKIYFAFDWDRNNNIKITFRSISESYYKYKEKQFAYLFSLENDIFSGMSEPINLYSNITGGYGIFAGYTSDEKPIIVSGK